VLHLRRLFIGINGKGTQPIVLGTHAAFLAYKSFFWYILPVMRQTPHILPALSALLLTVVSALVGGFYARRIEYQLVHAIAAKKMDQVYIRKYPTGFMVFQVAKPTANALTIAQVIAVIGPGLLGTMRSGKRAMSKSHFRTTIRME
jgi:hypothetical protein